MKRQVTILSSSRIRLVLIIAAAVVILTVMWWKSGYILPMNIVNIGQKTAEQISSLFAEDFNINEEKFSVDPKKLIGGGPPKDGILSIDKPKFVKAVEANFLKEEDVVFGLLLNGEAKAFPQRILVWHEIVNDVVGGEPVLISYCPLCLTSIAYERKVNGVVLEFGVSGKLYNSNLVMYSRANNQINTESLWTQVGGEGIVGDLTGKKLKQLRLDTVKWGDWVKKYPSTFVLSTDTGFARDYNTDPYEGYYTSDGVFAPLENRDSRLFEKAVVFGIEIDGKTKAYPQEELRKEASFTDNFADKTLQIKRNSDGSVEIKNLTDGDEIVSTISFWFSWAAFHPGTEIFKAL